MPQPRPVPSAARGLLPAVVLLAGALAAGCSSTHETHASRPSPGHTASATASLSPGVTALPSSSADCSQPPPADVPGAAGALTQAQSGTFCLAAGQQLDVFLTAPGGRKPGVPRWTAIATSAPTVLSRRSSGILTAPVGVTPGTFQAIQPGTAELTSSVPGTGSTWHVSVLVR